MRERRRFAEGPLWGGKRGVAGLAGTGKFSCVRNAGCPVPEGDEIWGRKL